MELMLAPLTLPFEGFHYPLFMLQRFPSGRREAYPDTFKLQGVQIQQLIDGRTGLAVHPVPHRVQAFCGPTELNSWNLYYFSDDLADFFPQNSLPAHTLSPYCLVGSPTRQNTRQYLQV